MDLSNRGMINEEDKSGGERTTIRVLHVDDDPDIAEVTATALEREDDNLSVTWVTSAQKGLDMLAEDEYDCVVSDYQMPGMDGIEFLQAVREEDSDLPFILFTGKGSEEVASQAISAGVTDYLQKTSGAEEYTVLAKQIENVVTRQHAVERFRRFLESAPDAILIVDERGDIEQLNQQAESLFGYGHDELLGEPVEKLLPERFREDHVTHREHYMEAPETRPMGADLDLYALHSDGSEFPVDIAISPITIGGRTEVMAAIRDISTRKWREEQLRERERELERQNERLEDFASVVSHDLRNPLKVASTSIELARDSDDPANLDRAESALDRMEALIGDLLTLARNGQRVDETQKLDLVDEVKRSWQTVRTEPATLELGLDSYVLQADDSRLRQLLENLLSNAIEHGGEDVTIRVGLLDDEGFYVADDGPGIPPEEHEDIFEEGYSTTETGTGFGLSIVRSIAEAHGWSVTATESATGGARFEIRTEMNGYDTRGGDPSVTVSE